MIRTVLGAIAIVTIGVVVTVERNPYVADVLLWWSQAVMWLCGGMVALCIGGFGLWMAHRARRRERTMVDGAWTMHRYRVRVWRRDLPWPLALWEYVRGYPGELDRNRMASAAWYVRSDGMVVEHTPASGWAVQHAYNLAVESTNYVRAAFHGDDWTPSPYMPENHQPRIPAPRPPRLGVPLLPGTADDDIVEGEFTPVAMPFTEALRSGNRTDLVLGQSDDGNVATWNVEQSPHIRVHGRTQGSGKTNLIKTLALCAVRAGHHVIVLDRRAFKDWSHYRAHVEFVDNRKPGAFLATALAVKALYQERDEMLGAAGAENIEALPDSPPRVFLVISEFGSAIRDLPDDERTEVVAVLKTIISEAGATGVHLIMEDQTNSKWPREIRGNAEPVTGYLPEDTAAAGGYRHAFKLGRYEFYYDGVRFRTWDMRVEAPALLRTVQPSGEVMVDVTAFGVRSGEKNSDEDENGPNSIVFTPNEHRTNDATELQQLVWAWRDVNPNGTQAELRREFEQRGIKIARGYAHQCWHDWPGAADEPKPASYEPPVTGEDLTPLEQLRALGIDPAAVRLPGGDRIGVDVAYTTNGSH